ncbi:MAG: GntR family transcriptional regulator [Victivallales bacterium]|nr:GntR family transcriptional regulator [Victivallales bacterium]
MKYHDVKQKLLQYIFQHKMVPGDILPSERWFCMRWNISNQPMRRAVAELCAVNALKKRLPRGLEVGSGWVAAEYQSTMAMLSVGVMEYPSEIIQERLKSFLRPYFCQLKVFHADEELDREIIGEMSACDYIVISGFLNLDWIEAVQSLEKPTLLLGHNDYQADINSMEIDIEDAYYQMLVKGYEIGGRRFLCWLPAPTEHTDAREYHEAFDSAVKRANLQGATVKSIVLRDRSFFAIEDAKRLDDDFDTLLMRDHSLCSLVFLRDWQSWLGNRKVFITNTSDRIPDGALEKLGIYKVVFQDKMKLVIDYFFPWDCKIPGGGKNIKAKAMLIPPESFETLRQNWQEHSDAEQPLSKG